MSRVNSRRGGEEGEEGESVRRGLEEGEIKDQRESIIVPIILLTLHFTAAARHS